MFCVDCVVVVVYVVVDDLVDWCLECGEECFCIVVFGYLYVVV